MEYGFPGNTGLRVSEYAFGTISFGGYKGFTTFIDPRPWTRDPRLMTHDP